MKRNIVSLFLFITISASGQNMPDWENPAVIGINKEEYHATLTLPSGKSKCEEIVSLDGIWKFNWSPQPDIRPVDFYKNDFSVANWDDIVVTGNWQMQGYGMPIYSNWTYPFKKDQPRVMSEPPKEYFSYKNRNPVGSYVTTFQIPQEKETSDITCILRVWNRLCMCGLTERKLATVRILCHLLNLMSHRM